jgi:phosphate uptake regulator
MSEAGFARTLRDLPISITAGGIVTPLEVHMSAQTLGLHLVDMCQIASRSVDYAVRALQGNPDLIASARESAYEIQTLHSEAIELAHELLLIEALPLGRELRFVMSSIWICDSLQAIQNNAADIASNTMRFWGNGGGFELTDFPWMGDGVYRLVECCAESLMDENIDPAGIVLSTDGLERELMNMFHDWYATIEHTKMTQAKYAFAIARSLSRIVNHAREMAGALVFWLADEQSESLGEMNRMQLMEHLTPESINALEAAVLGQASCSSDCGLSVSRRDAEEITHGPDGMEAFLAEIDRCFADPCFWSGL